MNYTKNLISNICERAFIEIQIKSGYSIDSMLTVKRSHPQ